MAYIIEDQLKEVVEEADREKALKEVAKVLAKDKGKVAKDAKEKANAAEKARALEKQRLTKANMKLGGIELKLAEAESLSLVQATNIV